MRHAVGQVSGFESRATQSPRQCQRRAAGIEEDKIRCGDEGSRCLGNALFLRHRQRFLRAHAGLVGQKLAVRQGRAAVDFVQLPKPIQLVQIAPDGGFAGIQGLAQFLHRRCPLFGQKIQDQAEPFFC